MKTITGLILLALIGYDGIAQKKRHDSLAILIIDRMADVIGDLGSCSFKLNTAQDVPDTSAGMVKRFTDYEVYMQGPDKMLINAHGYKGHRQLWYNGQQLAYYSFDENNYALVGGYSNIIKTIDSINLMYDIEFPAADFFYPAFTDDLIENADSIRFLGKQIIGGIEMFHIVAVNKDAIFQFWINNDAYNLPARFAVTYKMKTGQPQYLATFSGWNVNPSLPIAMFDFLPPPGASRIRLVARTER